MAEKSSSCESIFPNSGNDDADAAWATIVAQLHLELRDWENDSRLVETLHAITGKEEQTTAESVYFLEVRGARQYPTSPRVTYALA